MTLTIRAVVSGEAIAMASQAGAKLVDLEFVQFHPTALDVGIDPAPLLTEAIRGEGAFIVDENNNRFVFNDNDLGELAPRDIVSRSIHNHKLKGHVLRDARQHIHLKPAQPRHAYHKGQPRHNPARP